MRTYSVSGLGVKELTLIGIVRGRMLQKRILLDFWDIANPHLLLKVSQSYEMATGSLSFRRKLKLSKQLKRGRGRA